MKSPARVRLASAGIVGLSVLCFAAPGAAKVHPEAARAVREAAARARLSALPRALALYVRGLCCASCGIGVRKKIGKLDFVDRTRLNKGVEIDPKMQIAFVALKPKRAAPLPVLAKAVRDAGYELALVYRLGRDGKLRAEVPREPRSRATAGGRLGASPAHAAGSCSLCA